MIGNYRRITFSFKVCILIVIVIVIPSHFNLLIKKNMNLNHILFLYIV